MLQYTVGKRTSILRVHKYAFGLLVVSCSAIAQQVDGIRAANENRTTRADQALTRIVQDQKSLGRNEFFLLSLKKTVTQKDLLSAVGQDEINVTAIHVCDRTGGISAFFIETNDVFANKLEKIRQESRISANSAIMNIPSTDPKKRQALSTDSIIREDFRVCGLEVQSSVAQLIALRERMQGNIRSIEVTNRSVRKLPIHVVD